MTLNRTSSTIVILLLLAVHGRAASPADSEMRLRAEQTMLDLPLRFEENTGSFDSSVKFLARGRGYTLFLTPNESVLTIQQGKDRASARRAGARQRPTKASVVRVRLQSANTAPILRGEEKFTTPTNYLIGNDPEKWRTASNYERVRVESVYPGVDMLYYGKQRGIEYDFEVAPGADPGRIALRYEGVRRLRVGEDGSLVSILKGGGEVRQNRPISYQMIDGERREVASRYVVTGKQTVAFELGEYDPAEPLVIDPPVISYSTYLGGVGENVVDEAFAIAVDDEGLIYVAGTTASLNFPAVNQYQTNQAGTDAFVAKFNPLLSGAASLLYSTYLGGGVNDSGKGIAVDDAGNVFVTGDTTSTDFPTLNQYQLDQTGIDAFLTKLDTNASGAASLVYSTYIGGTSNDLGQAVAIGGAGNAFITGYTASTDFPTVNQYQSDQPSTDAFLAKIDPTLSGALSLLYSTYLGGDGADVGAGLAVNAGGTAFVVGETTSTNFPTLNQYQLDQPDKDAFISKIDTGASGAASLLYSTYLGGSNIDLGVAVAVDGGRAYVAGQTFSNNFPVLNQYQGMQGAADAFVTKLDTTVSGAASLLYSTHLGGSGSDIANGIAFSAGGTAFVTGYTASGTFPTVDALQTDQPGEDAFVARVNTNLSGAASLPFATYLGGDGDDQGRGVAAFSGDIYVTGRTGSTNFPTANQFQSDQGDADAFVTRYAVGFELASAVSRKTHGGTSFDINLPLSGQPGVERRSGSAHTLIFTFNRNVASGDVSIANGGGAISGAPTFSGATMTVNLASVQDIQTFVLNLSNVTATGGAVLPSVNVSINFLLGDTNGNKTVNASDIGQTKANSGAVLSNANFRADTNVSGGIGASDIGQVKANAGHTITP